MENAQLFRDLRNKHIAHLELQTSREGTFEIVAIEGPTWGVKRLIRIGRNLLTVALDKSEDFDQSCLLFKKDAKDFWEISHTP